MKGIAIDAGGVRPLTLRSPLPGAFPGTLTRARPIAAVSCPPLAERDALVPEVWSFEIANVIFVSFRRKRITEPQITEYLDLLKALPIRVEPHDLWANVGLEAHARRWNLAAYDAAYLDLALRKGLPLATSDGDLKAAALAEGIEVL